MPTSLQHSPEGANLIGTVEIDRRLPLYRSYCHTSSFTIEAGDKTCFSHEKRKVILSRDELNQQRSIYLIDFDVFHELGHLIQLLQDPKGYQKLIDVHKREDGLGKNYFTFYNCVLDVHVNSMIANRYATYRDSRGGFSQDIKDYYSRTLFSARDLSDLPLSQQFAIYLLNLGMGVAEDLILSPEVRETTGRKFNLFGRTLTIEDFLNGYVKEHVKPVGASSLSITSLRREVDRHLLPIFEELLQEDLKQQNKLDSIPDLLPNSLSFSEDDLKNLLDCAINDLDEKEKSPGDRLKDKVIQQLGEGDPDLQSFIAETLTKYQAEIIELRKVFERLRFVTEEIQHHEVRQQLRGHDLNVNDVIDQFGTVQIAPDEAHVMESKTTEIKVTYHPKKIKISLLLDLSGSMNENLEQLKEGMVIFSAALIAFNESSESRHNARKTSLEIVAYDDKADWLLEFNEDLAMSDLLSALQGVTKYGGGTDSSIGLSLIEAKLDTLPPVTSTSDEVAIVIEFTDGDTHDAHTSKQMLEAIQKKGALTYGIKFVGSVGVDRPKILSPMNSETELPPEEIAKHNRTIEAGSSFDLMHGENGILIRKIPELPNALATALKSLLDQE